MIKVKKLCPGDLPPPKQSKPGDAGYDLRSAADEIIYPGEQKAIPTGYAWEIPFAWAGLVRPRSGLALNHRIDVRAGVVDSGFRNEVMAVLVNEGSAVFRIRRGDRIAQMVVVPHWVGDPLIVDTLSDTERGTEGWGSTGNE